DELFASQVSSPLAFAGKLPLDHHLSSNSSVICPRQPKCHEATHAMPANHDIHLRLIEHVAHMQTASHVGRRKKQSEYRTRVIYRRRRNRKKLLFDPEFRPPSLDSARFVSFWQFGFCQVLRHEKIQQLSALVGLAPTHLVSTR